MDKYLESSLGYLVYRAARALVNGLSKRFTAADYDVTVEQWRVMMMLWNRDGQTQQELSEATGKKKTSITRLIHGMEKRSLVVRVPDQRDHRQNLIYLTRKGKELQNDLMALARQNVATAQAGIAARDLETCKEVLRQVIGNLQAIPE
jgi:DNA-binding MarR family transcriptional regulator